MANERDDEVNLLKRDKLRLQKILWLEKHRGHIPTDAVYSPEDVHLAMTVTPMYDDFGNLRLES